jgi:hypothetical protein
VHPESGLKHAGRWAGVFVCLLLVLVLAIAGPLHSHDDLSKADAGCTLCHAGERSIVSPLALDAGKPAETEPAELVISTHATPPLGAPANIRSPRAPPFAIHSGRLG